MMNATQQVIEVQNALREQGYTSLRIAGQFNTYCGLVLEAGPRFSMNEITGRWGNFESLAAAVQHWFDEEE